MLSRLRPLALLAPIGSLLLIGIAVAAGGTPGDEARTILDGLASSPSASVTPAAGDAGIGEGGTGVLAAPTSAPILVAEGPINEAKKALEKGKQLRSMGDTARADLADELALEWAQTASELVAAVSDERTADDEGKKAIDAVTKAERARQLLEEAIARRGRLMATLEALDKELADKALDAGPPDTKPPPKKKPKTGGAP
jgi:hypothetical protein